MGGYFYDRSGRAVGFREGMYIFDMNGRPIGFIEGTHVYKISGPYVGEIHRDMVVDQFLSKPGSIGRVTDPGNVGRADDPGNRGAMDYGYPDVFHVLFDPEPD